MSRNISDQNKRRRTRCIKCEVYIIPSFENSKNCLIARARFQSMKLWCHSRERWPSKLECQINQLCDAKTGYCKNFSMYAGKDDRAVGAIGKTGRVVMDLVADLHKTNHHLYVDNFYTSPVLFLLLKERYFSSRDCKAKKGLPI